MASVIIIMIIPSEMKAIEYVNQTFMLIWLPELFY